MTLNKSWKHLLAAAAACCAWAAAAATTPGAAPFDYTLPDGCSVEVTLHGCDRSAYYLSSDGYVLLPDRKGWLYYAAPSGNSIAPTKIRVNSGKGLTLAAAQYLSTLDRPEIRARAQRQLATPGTGQRADSASDTFQAVGSPVIPVILAEFKDCRFGSASPAADISALLNDSVSSWFASNSGGHFTPRFKVLGPVTLPKKMAWYGAPQGFTPDSRATRAVTDAIDMLAKTDSQVDFSEFDNDGDGVADNIAIVFAGRGQNNGGPAWSLWPASGNLRSEHGIDIELDGVRLGNFVTADELYGADGPDVASMAAFCQGMGEIIGIAATHDNLFDLTGREQALPLLTAPQRMAAGWLKPRELTGSETVSLRDISFNEALRINVANSTGFYLIENRRDNGLTTWHITGSAPHGSRATAVDPAALPALAVDNISVDPASGVVTFDFNGGGAPATPPETLAATDVTPVSFTANWTPVPGAVAYEIDVCPSGQVIPSAHLTVAASSLSATVHSLEPSSAYSYVVRSVTARNKSVDSTPQSVTTAQASFDMLTAAVLEPTAVGSSSFTANWQSVPDAEAYLLSVYRKESARPRIAAADFGERSVLPEGWLATTAKTGEVTGFYGQAAPSLDMAGGDCIASPVLPDDITAVSFWYRPRRRATQSSLRVDGLIDGNWCEIAVIPLNEPSQGQTARLGTAATPVPPGVRAVRLTVEGGGGSAVFVDDIAISYGSNFTPVYVDGYNSLNVGNSLSHTIDGLSESTAYFYTVTALSQGETSRKSAEAVAVTDVDTSINRSILPDSDTIAIQLTADGVTVANNSGTVRDVVCTTLSGETVFRTKLNPSATVDIPLGHNAIYVVSCHTASIKIRR